MCSVYQVVKKIDSRKLPPAARNERRRRAVKMREAGVVVRDVAEFCQLSTHTVVAAHKAFRQGGWAAVDVRPGHRPKGAGGLLPQEQQNRILATLLRPGQPGLWNRTAVAELIERECGLRLSPRALGKYLDRWGLILPRPELAARAQAPAIMDSWMQTVYPALVRRVRRHGGKLAWTVFTHVDAPQARRRAVRLLAAVSPKGETQWMLPSGPLDDAMLIGFFERLLVGRQNQLLLLMGMLRQRPSQRLMDWLAAHAGRLEVQFLPGCLLDAQTSLRTPFSAADSAGRLNFSNPCWDDSPFLIDSD